ncbi:MAG: hypothetical protein Ta2A_22860 [Treponemataceae bacterium]|nr:MAG: hypothetical protein Ta2A_22860 [Treponemataceae bacterium]
MKNAPLNKILFFMLLSAVAFFFAPQSFAQDQDDSVMQQTEADEVDSDMEFADSGIEELPLEPVEAAVFGEGRADDNPQQFYIVGADGTMQLITDQEEIANWGNKSTSYFEREMVRTQEASRLTPSSDTRPAGIPPKTEQEDAEVTSAKLIAKAFSKTAFAATEYDARLFVSYNPPEYATKSISVKKLDKMMLVEFINVQDAGKKYLRKNDTVYIFNPVNKSVTYFPFKTQGRNFEETHFSYFEFFAFDEIVARYVIIPVFSEIALETSEGERTVYQVTLLANNPHELYPELIMYIDNEDFRLWRYELFALGDGTQFVREKRKEYNLISSIRLSENMTEKMAEKTDGADTAPLGDNSVSVAVSAIDAKNNDGKYYPVLYEMIDYNQKTMSTFIEIYRIALNDEANVRESDFSEKALTARSSKKLLQ